MSRYARFLIPSAAIAVAGPYLESRHLPPSLEFIHEPSSVSGISRGYALVLAINIMIGLWVILVGMSVGGKRKSFMSKAKKDGEENVEERYSLPNLYVSGGTKHSRAFNCVQRAHQQILETLPQFFLMALVSGLSFPGVTFVVCVAWLYARYVWVQGYMKSEGDAIKRYSHPFAAFIWTGMLGLFLTSLRACYSIAFGN